MSLDAIGIVSSDLAKSIQFYGLLGADLKTVGGEGHMESSTPSGVRIMVDSVELVKEINPNWEKPSGSSPIILCFLQQNAGEVDRIYNEITTAGFKSVTKPWDAFWGQRYSSVQDPDGNQIDIFASLK